MLQGQYPCLVFNYIYFRKLYVLISLMATEWKCPNGILINKITKKEKRPSKRVFVFVCTMKHWQFEVSEMRRLFDTTIISTVNMCFVCYTHIRIHMGKCACYTCATGYAVRSNRFKHLLLPCSGLNVTCHMTYLCMLHCYTCETIPSRWT